MPSSSLAPASAISPSSPLSRSVSLGPQPGNTSASSAAQALLQQTSGGATPPRKSIALGGAGGSGAGSSGRNTPVPGGGPGKTRARDLLRKHYGLGVGPPPASTKSSPDDPMDLSAYFLVLALPNSDQDVRCVDSAAFDAKSYYEQLITTSSLPTLLRKENELISGSLSLSYIALGQ